VDQHAAQRRQSERRRLFDRRSPLPRREYAERRRAQRRVLARPVAEERRSGHERRRAERRVLERRTLGGRRREVRRRDTPAPFSMAHVELLRERFATRGPVTCPACGGQLSLGVARPRGGSTIRRVSCFGCGRAAILSNTRAARVLVIEEKDAFREGLRAILADAGHEVVEATDAGVGLAAYGTGPADVILIDVLASGRMEAAEFVRRLRRDFPEARIVAIAGRPSFVSGDPLAIVRSLGPATTIRMPFTPAELLRAVEEARGVGG